MCDLFVGRVSVTLGDVRVSSLDLTGPDRMRVRGRVEGTEDQVGHIAEQLRGLVSGSDEPFVPVYWIPCANASSTPGLTRQDGYYEVTDVDMGMDSLDWASLTLTVRRVQGFAAPLMEAVVLGGKRAGVRANVTAQAWQALPATVMGYENGAITPTVETVATETGNLSLFTDAVNELFNARVEYYLPPASWYVGAASLSVAGRLIVGRDCPNDPDGWVLSNGRIRLSGVTGSGEIKLEHWSGSAWVNNGSYRFGQYGGGAQPSLTAPPLAITVLRNGPECATIRLAYDAASIITNARFAVNVDISLRRGADSAEVYLESRGAYRWLLKTPFTFTGMVEILSSGATASPTTGAAAAWGNAERFEPPGDPVFGALAANGTWMAVGIGHVFGTVNTAALTKFGQRYAAAMGERVLAVAR